MWSKLQAIKIPPQPARRSDDYKLVPFPYQKILSRYPIKFHYSVSWASAGVGITIGLTVYSSLTRTETEELVALSDSSVKF